MLHTPTATGSFPDKLLSQVTDAIDYITRIGNSSHAPIVIVDFAMAHLCRIPALLTEGDSLE